MKITVQGQVFNIIVDPKARVKTCGWCEGGLVYYAIWKFKRPYEFIGRCECGLGRGYRMRIWDKKGDMHLVEPECIPFVNPRKVQRIPDEGIMSLEDPNRTEGCSDPDLDPDEEKQLLKEAQGLEESVPF